MIKYPAKKHIFLRVRRRAHPGGGYHARGLEGPESGRLKGLQGIPKGTKGEDRNSPVPFGPAGGAFPLGESSAYIKLAIKFAAVPSKPTSQSAFTDSSPQKSA